MDFTHIHASMNGGRTAEAGKRAINHYRSLSDVITTTENSGRRSKIATWYSGNSDWATFQPEGDRGERHNVITYDTRVFEPAADGWAEKLTDARWLTKGGGRSLKVHATVLPLRHKATGRVVWIIASHPPAHIEGRRGFESRSRKRIQAAKDAIENTGRLARRILDDHPGDAVINTADWNLNVKRGWVRRYIGKRQAPLKLRFNADDFPRHGTHGKSRIIDFGYSFGLEGTNPDILPKRRDASDHRAVRVRHAFTGAALDLFRAPDDKSRGPRIDRAADLLAESLNGAIRNGNGDKGRAQALRIALDAIYSI